MFQEEYDAFGSALVKIDALGQNDKPPPDAVESDEQFDLLDRASDITVFTDASMYHFGIYIRFQDLVFTSTGEIPDEMEDSPAIDRELF